MDLNKKKIKKKKDRTWSWEVTVHNVELRFYWRGWIRKNNHRLYNLMGIRCNILSFWVWNSNTVQSIYLGAGGERLERMEDANYMEASQKISIVVQEGKDSTWTGQWIGKRIIKEIFQKINCLKAWGSDKRLLLCKWTFVYSQELRQTFY